MPDQRQSLGAWGEKIALNFLLDKGDRLLARNVRTAYGELDLVTRRGNRTVFVEVKTRRTNAYGLPEESVTAAKFARVSNSALAFLTANPEFDGDWQIDVIAIRISAGLPPQIAHFENAYTG